MPAELTPERVACEIIGDFCSQTGTVFRRAADQETLEESIRIRLHALCAEREAEMGRLDRECSQRALIQMDLTKERDIARAELKRLEGELAEAKDYIGIPNHEVWPDPDAEQDLCLRRWGRLARAPLR